MTAVTFPSSGPRLDQFHPDTLKRIATFLDEKQDYCNFHASCKALRASCDESATLVRQHKFFLPLLAVPKTTQEIRDNLQARQRYYKNALQNDFTLSTFTTAVGGPWGCSSSYAWVTGAPRDQLVVITAAPRKHSEDNLADHMEDF